MKLHCLPILNIGIKGRNLYGPELFTFANAAADPNGTEANATTGLTVGSGAIATSVGSPVSVGNYAINIESNTSPTVNARGFFDMEAAPFNIKNGDEVKLILSSRHIGVGGNWSINLAATAFGINNPIKTVFTANQTYDEEEVVYTHDANRRYLNFREQSGSNDGGLLFDNCSVKVKQ